VSRNREYALTIGHHDVFALTGHSKAGLFKRPDRVDVIDARDPRHALSDLDLTHFRVTEQLITDG
jgi:hypothetical protein